MQVRKQASYRYEKWTGFLYCLCVIGKFYVSLYLLYTVFIFVVPKKNKNAS